LDARFLPRKRFQSDLLAFACGLGEEQGSFMEPDLGCVSFLASAISGLLVV
jgi:hypothetical protein